MFIGYTYMGNGILSPQVNFVAKLDLPMCLNLKQQGCLRWLACWATWATNLLTNLLFWGMFICTCIEYGLRCFCLFPF